VDSTHGLPQVEKLFDSGKVIRGDAWSLFSVKNLNFFFFTLSVKNVKKILVTYFLALKI